jgi:hypothetical protein
MAVRVTGRGGWRLSRRSKAAVREHEQITTVEQAARLAPEWAHVEARHASEPQVSLPQVSLYR